MTNYDFCLDVGGQIIIWGRAAVFDFQFLEVILGFFFILWNIFRIEKQCAFYGVSKGLTVRSLFLLVSGKGHGLMVLSAAMKKTWPLCMSVCHRHYAISVRGEGVASRL